MAASGSGPNEIARYFGVTSAAASVFLNRPERKAAIADMKEEYIAELQEYAIANVGYRMGEIQTLYTSVDSWQDKHGLSEKIQRFDKYGNLVGESIRFRSDVVNAKRGLLSDAAAEVGGRKQASTIINKQLNIYSHGDASKELGL